MNKTGVENWNQRSEPVFGVDLWTRHVQSNQPLGLHTWKMSNRGKRLKRRQINVHGIKVGYNYVETSGALSGRIHNGGHLMPTYLIIIIIIIIYV